jgi:hypothetical protein
VGEERRGHDGYRRWEVWGGSGWARPGGSSRHGGSTHARRRRRDERDNGRGRGAMGEPKCKREREGMEGRRLAGWALVG